VTSNRNDISTVKDGVIGLIPARSGSKAVPDKNIKLLAGKPLIAYSIEVARQVKSINRVIVSTDSAHYADIARKYGSETPFLRPAEISGDDSTDYEFVKHLLDWYQETGEELPNYIVHLRPTTPFRDPDVVESAIELIKAHPHATALRSVNEMVESSYKTFEIDCQYLKSVCSGSFDLDLLNVPRQRFTKTYRANGYVDIIKTSYVLENNKLHGNRVLPFITPIVGEIDTLDDFKYLEYRWRAKDVSR